MKGKSKDIIIKSYLSPAAKVGKSVIHGWGLIAVKPIKKGEIIGIKSGHILNKKTFKKLGGFNNFVGAASLQIADNFFIAPTKKSEFKRFNMFVNHSCNPNIRFMGNIISVAARNIKKGEELTNDYARHISDQNFKIKCNCGTKNCRKIITGKDWKNLGLQKKYKGSFSSYLQEKINKR